VGTVTDVILPFDRATGRPRGFAFVEFSSDEEAAAAIEKMDGKEVAGRALKVGEARDRPPRIVRDLPDTRGFGAGNRPFKSKGSRRGIRGRKRSL